MHCYFNERHLYTFLKQHFNFFNFFNMEEKIALFTSAFFSKTSVCRYYIYACMYADPYSLHKCIIISAHTHTILFDLSSVNVCKQKSLHCTWSRDNRWLERSACDMCTASNQHIPCSVAGCKQNTSGVNTLGAINTCCV